MRRRMHYPLRVMLMMRTVFRQRLRLLPLRLVLLTRLDERKRK